MKKFRVLWMIGAIVLLFLQACVKDEVIENTSTIRPGSQQIFTTTLFGTVIDAQDNPIQNAKVVYHSAGQAQNSETDEFGNFYFEDVQNRGPSAFITVEYPGKFEAFRRFGVLEDRYNRTIVKMLDKEIIGQISAEQGGKVSHNNGASVELPANGIIDAQGNLYNGIVEVALAWVDPSADDLAERMIGDLSGIDRDGNNRSLITYGMLQVELFDVSGQELNLAEGMEAELSFPVPADMRSNAKDEAPLWIYEEDLGTWIEEGIAKYENGKYVGKVPHFSSFNIDFKGEVIEITGQVKWNTSGDTLNGTYLQVFVCSESIGNRGGWLCDDGSFRFYNFPRDVEFTIKVKDACGQVLYEEEFGPFAESTDLGDIMVNFGINNVSVTGTAVNCDGDPVTQGLVQVRTENRSLTFPVENGVFNFSVDLCDGSDGELIVIDTESQLQSDVITIDDGNNVLDLGEIELCDDLQEYIEFTVDGQSPVLLTPDVTYKEIVDGQRTLARIEYNAANSPDSTGLGTLTMELSTVPFSPSTNITIDCEWFSYFDQSNRTFYFAESSSIEIVFEEFDSNIGGKMKGSFSGLVNIEGGASDLPINGSFDFTVK
jgi:hypothetical protein